MRKKKELEEFVRSRTGFGYDSNRLVIGWARRIAGYKRPQSMFDDIKRLESIVKDKNKPVQILIAGKAHPKDVAAKKMLQQMIAYMQNELSGHAIFIPNYDITVARMMVKGVDVWMNTPILGQEACGTSGMKAISNGVLQLTVEDGWAAEVDWHHMGWTLDSTHLSPTLYLRLEDDIIPAYYSRDENNVPQDWLHRMKKSVRLVERFSATRMLKEYEDKLYA